MSKISKKLDAEIRLEAKNRCGYCLGEQKYILRGSKSNISILAPKAGKQSKKIYGWLAHIVILSKVHKLTAETRRPKEKFLFSIRERKFGKNILSLIPTKPRLSVKPYAVGQRLMLSKSTTNWLSKRENIGLGLVGIRRKIKNDF